MNAFTGLFTCALSVLALFQFSVESFAIDDAVPLRRIALGSCARQGEPQPIWNALIESNPDLFVFLGDNIYGDTEDMEEMKAKWKLLAEDPGFKKFREKTPILATWDDHDFGVNDGGVEYPKKAESQQVFLDFFAEPADSPRRKREGVYDSKVYGPPGKRVQIILLDARYFRSPLAKEKIDGEPGEGIRGPYIPDWNVDSTILGADQWAWLEEQLKVPAEIRIVASGIQVIPDEHGWEKWGNFPRERERLFRLIRDTDANGVVFVTGDRHHAEICRLDGAAGYPLYDLTTSSLNQKSEWVNEQSSYRRGLNYYDTNFGIIDVDWDDPDPTIRIQTRSEDGEVVLQEKFPISRLWPWAKENLAPGYTALFNEKDLTGWIGDTKGYAAEEGALVCNKGGFLFTDKEYANFVFRLEFKLPPGGNNGIGIRAPIDGGNPAYRSMELQILDNTAEKYDHLKPYQYHGSIYGISPAKRGALNPVGEWNSQQVIADGKRLTVILNETVIVDTDLEEAIANGTLDGNEHDGLLRETGHVGFLGHGDRIEFRNLFIKELD